MANDGLRRAAVITAAVAQIACALLAPLGLAPVSVGERTQPVDNPIVPAGYAFSIWSVIFLTGLIFAVWQALPRNRDDPLLRRLGWPVAAAFAGNAVWQVLAVYGAPETVLAAVLALIVVAALLALRILVRAGEPSTPRRWWIVDLPIGLTAGWVSAALFANLSTALQATLAPPATSLVWPVLLLGALAFGLLQLARARGQMAFAAAFAWAVAAIAVANLETANPPVLWIAALGVLAVFGTVLLVRRRAGLTPARAPG